MGVDVMSPSLLAQGSERGKFDLSVFHQSWWQQIAQGFPGYRELKVMRDGRLVGRLPFVLRRNRLGLAFGQDPGRGRARRRQIPPAGRRLVAEDPGE